LDRRAILSNIAFHPKTPTDRDKLYLLELDRTVILSNAKLSRPEPA